MDGRNKRNKRAGAAGRAFFAAGCVFLTAGALLLLAARISGTFAQWYSTHIYPVWVQSIGRVSGLLPFSLSEVLLYLLLVWTVFAGAVRINRAIRRKSGRGESAEYLVRFFLIGSILFFLYVMNCGINYQRETFAESAELSVKEYSADELKEVCVFLTKEVNALSGEVKRDENGVMKLEEGAEGRAVAAMQSLGDSYTELAGYYPKPKGLFVWQLLAVQNLTGVYSPFTIEANYNSGMADYNKPFTMCHELSHLRGFMQEEEANFIGFLACFTSEDAEFRYSGSLLGWIYCMNALRKADYDAWEETRDMLGDGAETDLRANREYWDKYDGAAAEVSNRVNDTYLKANGQADGVESYDRMVDLVVAYYDKILYD